MSDKISVIYGSNVGEVSNTCDGLASAQGNLLIAKKIIPPQFLHHTEQKVM
jgi:hypothetical protein